MFLLKKKKTGMHNTISCFPVQPVKCLLLRFTNLMIKMIYVVAQESHQYSGITVLRIKIKSV